MRTADDLEKQTKAKRQGAEDGGERLPPSNAQQLSGTEKEIINLGERELAEFIQTSVRKLGAVQRKHENALKSVQPTAVEPAALEGQMRAILREQAGQVSQAAIERERLARQLRKFKLVNGIEYDLKYNPSYANLIGLAIFAIAIEAMANSYFFGQASNAGLIGGAATAALVSVCNVGVGFITGVLPFRFMNHKTKLHLLWAFPTFLISLLAAFAFNMVVGHYREALVLNPDAEIVAAIPKAIDDIFAVKSFESVVLVIIGCVIYLFSLYKGYTVWSTYPGYMDVHQAHSKAAEIFDTKRNAVASQLTERFGDLLNDFVATEAKLKGSQAEIAAMIATVDGVTADVETVARQQEVECNVAISYYREANRTVRGDASPPPIYFQAPVKLTGTAVPAVVSKLRSDLLATLQTIDIRLQESRDARRKFDAAHGKLLGDLDGAISSAEKDAEAAIDREIDREARERRVLAKGEAGN